MNFYNDARASSNPSHEWEKDQDGIWERREAAPGPGPGPGSSRTSGTTPSSYTYLFETQAAFKGADMRDGTNATSISSIVTQHDLDADRGEDNPETSESEESNSGRATPYRQQSNMNQTLAGIGDALVNGSLLHRRPTRLNETYDEFGKTFVEYKKRDAVGKIQAASAGKSSHPGGPYQLAVLPHDDLCPSNGPERMNEERANVCAKINMDTHAGENCIICLRPPDYYEPDY